MTDLTTGRLGSISPAGEPLTKDPNRQSTLGKPKRPAVKPPAVDPGDQEPGGEEAKGSPHQVDELA